MPEEKIPKEKPPEKESDLLKLKKSQDSLKAEIAGLERVITKKKDVIGHEKQKDIEELIKKSIRQNKKLADKVDFLMSTLIDASQTMGEENVEKTLTVLARSQVDLLGQVADLKDKIESAETLKEIRRLHGKSLEEIDSRLLEFEKTLANMPYSDQVNSLKKEVDSLSEEIKIMESLITSQAPDEASTDINLVKEDIGFIKKKISKVSRKLSKMEKERGEALPEVTAIDALQAKISSMETDLENVVQLIEKGDMKKDKELKQKLLDIEGDLEALTKLKTDIDLILKQNQEEREKMTEILGRLVEIDQDLEKAEKRAGPPPESQISFIKQKLDELKRDIEGFKQEDIKARITQEMAGLKERLSDIEKILRSKNIPVKKKKSQDEKDLEEKRVLDFISKQPIYKQVKLSLASKWLGIRSTDLLKVLRQIQRKEKGKISLRNITYTSKLMRKKPCFVRLK